MGCLWLGFELLYTIGLRLWIEMYDAVQVALADIHASVVGEFDADTIAMHIDDRIRSRHRPSCRVHSIFEIGEAEAGEEKCCDYKMGSHRNFRDSVLLPKRNVKRRIR